MYANPSMEQIAPEALRAVQLTRLKKVLSWAREKSPFYQNKFRACHVEEIEIASLEEIERLPFTTLEELQQLPAADFLTLPYSSLVRISLWEHPHHMIRMYTAGDVAVHVEMMARVLTAAGVHRASVVGILGDMADSGLMDAQYALELLGAAAIPLSTEYERVIRLLDEVGIDTIIGSSRRVLRLLVQAQAAGRDIAEYPVGKILCLSETLNTPLKNHIEKRTNTRVYNLFSSAEFGCFGMLYPCSAHAGQHLQEDYFYPEIVAFGGNEVVREPGRMGELVVTTLAAEAMPIIRGRTGQTVMREVEPCPCGRTLLRLTTPLGSI
ncbi:MAG: phenylacetate--CoA ligase family protein [Schwartzia sp. (in: firmicutes)]